MRFIQGLVGALMVTSSLASTIQLVISSEDGDASLDTVTPPKGPPKSPPRTPPKSPPKSPPQSPPKSPPKSPSPPPGGRCKQGCSLGKDPAPNARPIFQKYCKVAPPVKKKTRGFLTGGIEALNEDLKALIQDLEVFDLEALELVPPGLEDIDDETAEESCSDIRTLAPPQPPPGYTYVAMSSYQGQTNSQGGLWSAEFATCPGVIIVGDAPPGNPNAKTRWLFHMDLGITWDDVDRQWQRFANDISAQGLTHLRGAVYFPDARDDDPDVASDPDIRDMARATRPTYTRIYATVQEFVGKGFDIRVLNHRFGRTGKFWVGPDGVPKASTDP